MKFQHAKKLHNGDEVLDKQTGESLNVINVSCEKTWKPPLVILTCIGKRSGFCQLSHTDVK